MTPADSKAVAEEVAEDKPPKPSADEPKFTLERLIEDAQEAVGHPGHVVAGAYAGVALSKEVTLSQAKDRINKWLKAPVAVDEPSEEG